MDEPDRLTRLENALIDFVIVVTEGNLARLDAHMAPEVREAGERLQGFHRAVINERSS
ncbi:MAG: hypothetical protein ABSH04_02865 [Acidimicrobiales bacterium]|jgi:hypothetical protein